MAGELRLKLLGGCELTIDGEPLDKLFAKHQALLAFLAMTGQTHARQMIAGLLWGGKSEQDALRNLRVNLTKVRQIAGAYLAVGRQTIAFDQTSNYWLDVEAFEDCVERSRGANGRLNHALLREAVNLYDGDFMVGFELRDAPEFEEWLLSQRARLQPILIQALDALVEHCVDEGNYAEGIAYAYKLLDIEPWREETHQQLMWLLALDGQHSAALAQYDECCLILQRELGVLPMLETTQLKTDIQTMREKLEMRQTKPLPPLPDPEPETAVPFLAPPPVPYFLGRATEIDQLWQSICRENGQQRFVISGMGGVGKTALVIQFAHVLRQEFPDGVLWVKADSSDPMQIAEQWAAAYGYDFGSVADPASRMGALRQMLAEKKALLIFDDVAEAARIRPLLPTAGDCIMLFTTRNANLAPLLAASRLALHELSEKNGRLLLTHLIGQTRVEAESDAADHIGERLQNLPLALTIAGRYLAQRPRRRLSTFVTRLHEQGQRLATLELDNLAVRLSFMISWQALDTTQQEIFRYLGVFAGRAFTVEALAAVAQLHTFTAEDRLHTLVMLSLLGEEGEHHYRQHSLLADFAQEQLGEDENAHSRKVHFFLEFAQTYHTNYQMLEPEWANLLASVSTAQQLQQWQDILKLTQTLEQAWFARGRYSDAKLAYKIAYEASIQLESSRCIIISLLAWARACLEQGDYDTASDLLKQGLEISSEERWQNESNQIYYELARIALEQADYLDAQGLLRQINLAQSLSEGEGSVLQSSEVAYRQARVFFGQGRYEEAERHCLEAVTVQRDNNDRANLVKSLRLLATLAVEKRALTEARTLCEEAIHLADLIQMPGERASALYLLSSIQMHNKELDLAEMNLIESYALFKRVGDSRSQGIILYQWSWLEEMRGQFAHGLQLAQRSLDISSQLEDKRQMAIVLLHLGDLHTHLDKHADALKMWQKALDMARELDHLQLLKQLEKRLEQQKQN